MAKLTRTPGMTYGWMVVAIGIVAFLFRQWKLGMAQQRHTLWWTTLIVFLLFDYLFLLLPIRDGANIRRLTYAGKLWAALVWWTVLAFVAIVVPVGVQSARQKHPLVVGSAGLFFLAVLVYGL